MSEKNSGSASQSPRVFLSYARGDDEPFVKRLCADLTSAGFKVWFDRESLLSRGLTFHQEIKDAIRTEVDRVVYVGGPKAALSNYVREEWQFALECHHVVVTPILRLGDFEHVPPELSRLHCEDFREDTKYPDALARLITSLRQPNPKLGPLFAVPSLPPNFLGWPELMQRVRDALLVDMQKPQVITSTDARVGLQGMGGIGKSVLGPRCRMLVTTRDKGILDTLHGELVPVSLLTETEALQLLADAVNVSPPALPAEAREVMRECGCLPLALCGGMALKRGGDFHSVLERLRRADLERSPTANPSTNSTAAFGAQCRPASKCCRTPSSSASQNSGRVRHRPDRA